jgi:Fic family protein
MYIHERKDWPRFHWDIEKLVGPLASARYRQGGLIGQMKGLGFRLQQEAVLETLTKDVLKTSEIEGEKLDAEQVRSSVARRLGLDIGGLKPADRNVEGVVEMMLDATGHYDRPLTDERLFGWHAALFPTGRSGMSKIRTGAWRDESAGPMQVVSGAVGKEKVHFEAPKANRLGKEVTAFLKWFEGKDAIDPVLKAGLAHLWFVTIHPFEDGNGRIARAIADMALARYERSSQRFYSMSAQIEQEHKEYYAILESTQKGTLDVTCLDALVPGLPGPRDRRRSHHLKGRAGQGAILGSSQGRPAQQPAARGDQPPAGRVRRQAHKHKIREVDEVLAGYGLS